MMLPTQFIPEYYRDSKDIVNADEGVETEQEELSPRRSLLASILGVFRRSEKTGREEVRTSQEQMAHR